MRITIGSDHAGYEYKELIKIFLIEEGHDVIDRGTVDSNSVDYPDFVHPVIKDIIDDNAHYGLLICGTGNGVSMTANKYQEIRCGLCWEVSIAELIRQHNNANVMALPARFVDIVSAKSMVSAFINTPFEGGRHQRRIDKITSGLYSC